MTQTDPRPWWRRFNLTAGWLAAITAVTLVIAGPGHRVGWLGFQTAVQLSLVAAALSTLGFVVAALALLGGRVWTPHRFGISSLAALLLCGAVLVQLGIWALRATSVPPIHDISTDTEEPPPFVAIAPLRATAPNPVEYGGADVATAQRRAYPDIATVRVATSAAVAIDSAARYAEQQGWTVVAKDAALGRLEATATTFWYGYQDDIVVRARETNNGTFIDVRSKSRVGRSDLGTNAERIRALLAAIAADAT
ncbi:MAG: DUF1499 domain-containing protein [Pseudomonadota bacterium]